MSNQEFVQNMYKEFNRFWIEPEILQRQKNGTLPTNFKIYRCLIRLPKFLPAIVEFNEEIRWSAKAKLAPGVTGRIGSPIYLHEIQEIETVSPPEVDGQRVAFIYITWAGNGACHICFDFTPNGTSPDTQDQETMDDAMGSQIAKSLQKILVEKTIHIHDSLQKLLQTIGLWAAPSLLPYPLSKILLLLSHDDAVGAAKVLVDHCTPEFVEQLSNKWWNVPQFNRRHLLIDEAIDAHKNKKYHLSIHTILPHIEGIITDWTFTQLPEEEIPWKQESKTRQFKDLVLDSPLSTFTYQRIVESAIQFTLEGPVLATFRRWLDNIDSAFPNRHVIEHGKYEESLFTEENSLKLFLLIDTIHFIIDTHTNN